MPGFHALTLFALMAGAVPAEIELVRNGERQALSGAARARIADWVPRLFASCSLNSRDHPRTLVARESAWQEAEAKDHLSVRFAAPFDIRQPHGRTVSVLELMLGLADERFPGPELSRNGETVLAHAKCSGGDMIRFVCEPELRPLMPGTYAPLCAWLDQHGPKAFSSDRPRP